MHSTLLMVAAYLILSKLFTQIKEQSYNSHQKLIINAWNLTQGSHSFRNWKIISVNLYFEINL
jgi:hypothetical protein